MEVEEQMSQGTDGGKMVTQAKETELPPDTVSRVGAGPGGLSAEADKDGREATGKALADDSKKEPEVQRVDVQFKHNIGEKQSHLQDIIPETGSEVREPVPQTELKSMETEEATDQVDSNNGQPTEEDVEHQKMPDHPGRDSDSEYSENEGAED